MLRVCGVAGIDPDANGLAGMWGKVRAYGESVGIPVDCCYSTCRRYVNKWLVAEGESFGTLKAELKKFAKGVLCHPSRWLPLPPTLCH